MGKSINQKLDELASLRSLCEKVTPRIAEARGGGIVDPADMYNRLIDLSAEIDAEIDQYVDMRAEIESVIGKVTDETLKTLLRYKYINGYTWEKVAVEMDYSYMQVCRLHGKALNEISK